MSLLRTRASENEQPYKKKKKKITRVLNFAQRDEKFVRKGVPFSAGERAKVSAEVRCRCRRLNERLRQRGAACSREFRASIRGELASAYARPFRDFHPRALVPLGRARRRGDPDS